MPLMFAAVLIMLLAQPVFAQAPDSVRVARLAALGKLWNAARFLHPWLAYRPIDWDSALVDAVPRVREAVTAADYARAVQGMLDALGDPLTGVVTSETPGRRSVAEPDPSWRWTEDRVLVVQLTNYADLADFAGSTQRLAAVAPRIDSARAVVFDLRRLVAGSEGLMAFILAGSGVPARLVPDTLAGPGTRRRLHSGYRSDTGAGATFYYSAWQIADGAPVQPGKDVKAKPVAFVVNPRSELPPFAAALLAAGRAALIADGGANDGGDVVRLPLGEEVTVALRVSETVFADGSVGIVPDTVLTGDAVGSSAAIDAALDLVRASRSTPRRATPVPVTTSVRPPRAYPEMRYPALPYRLLAAYRIWGVLEYFNPYRHLVAEEWATALEDHIPLFEHAADSVAYAEAVARMLTRTHDSHVGFGPSALGFLRSGLLPARIRWIEEKPVVTSVLDTAAERAGLRVGDIVLAVDGVPADTLIATLAQVQPASTPQALMGSVLTRLGSGANGSEAAVLVQGGAGGPRTVRLRRSNAYGPQLFRSGREGPVFRILDGDIGYADLERLTVPMVDSMFRAFQNTRAIIFDMRGYPRGTAWSIAPRLVDRPAVPAAQFRRPVVTEPRGFGATGEIAGRHVYEFTQSLGGPVAPRYTGRTVMLIDERAISQSEHTGLFLKAANGTTFIGTPTVGANGDVTQFVIPGGMAVNFTGHDVRHADGRQLQRVGLEPDIFVAPTIAGIREGRDEILERALRYLREISYP